MRITDPTGPAPAATAYVTLPNTVPATISFLPSGTAYVEAFGGTPIVARVSGTNVSPTTVTTVAGVTPTAEGIVAQGTGSDAQFLILNQAGGSGPSGQTTTEDLTTNPPTLATTLSTNSVVGRTNVTIGPDGCLYAKRRQQRV